MPRAVDRASQRRIEDAAPLFFALGDPTRLTLVTRLASAGPGSIAALSADFDVSRQAITKHLDVLSGAGLVRSRREGREHIWELAPERLSDAHAFLELVSSRWDAALGRLAAMLEDE